MSRCEARRRGASSRSSPPWQRRRRGTTLIQFADYSSRLQISFTTLYFRDLYNLSFRLSREVCVWPNVTTIGQLHNDTVTMTVAPTLTQTHTVMLTLT